MLSKLPEYRITRPDVYTADGCPGKDDPSAREGYYVRAETRRQALDSMIRDFPNDTCFDVQLWGSPDIKIPKHPSVVRYTRRGKTFIAHILG